MLHCHPISLHGHTDLNSFTRMGLPSHRLCAFALRYQMFIGVGTSCSIERGHTITGLLSCQRRAYLRSSLPSPGIRVRAISAWCLRGIL